MSGRSRARAVALQVLYQEDLTSGFNPATGDALVQSRLRVDAEREFARELIAGVRRHRAELDEQLAHAAENWSLTRMAATDRNVLRIGAFEILHSATPDRVAIDEAVELARRYGAAQSGPFVNGILDRLMREKLGKEGSGGRGQGAE